MPRHNERKCLSGGRGSTGRASSLPLHRSSLERFQIPASEWENDELLWGKCSFLENQFFQNIRPIEIKMEGVLVEKDLGWGEGYDHGILPRFAGPIPQTRKAGLRGQDACVRSQLGGLEPGCKPGGLTPKASALSAAPACPVAQNQAPAWKVALSELGVGRAPGGTGTFS